MVTIVKAKRHNLLQVITKPLITSSLYTESSEKINFLPESGSSSRMGIDDQGLNRSACPVLVLYSTKPPLRGEMPVMALITT